MTQPSQVAPKLSTGDIIDQFTITGNINSRGGFAEIYTADETSSKRQAIVKVMRGSLSQLEQTLFRNEAVYLTELRGHPNVVEILHSGALSMTPFIIVERLGTELTGKLPYLKPVQPAEATAIMRDVLRGLDGIHSREIVHHDVRPDNVLRNDGAPWKLIDLGVSHRRPTANEGQAFGDKLYMSPEVIQGERNDTRSDLYSAGVMYYLLLTGRTPFGVWRNRTKDVRSQHLEDMVLPPDQAWKQSPIHPDAMRTVMRLLEKEPDRRYQRADEVLQDLAGVP